MVVCVCSNDCGLFVYVELGVVWGVLLVGGVGLVCFCGVLLVLGGFVGVLWLCVVSCLCMKLMCLCSM